MLFYSQSTGGFYDGGTIPGDAVEVTKQERNDLLTAQYSGKILRVVDGKVLADEPVVPLADVKAAQMAKINAQAQSVIDAYTSGYPSFERLTWATQEQESNLWESASESARTPDLVPWCANAANNRVDGENSPMPLADFMDKVAAKVAAFKQVSSTVAGKRQGYEDAISAATTPEEVTAIGWPTPDEQPTP